MRRTQRNVADAIGARAKFAVIYSPDRELVFGDGFFHNTNSPVNPLYCPKIIAPLTPNLAAAVTRPSRYMTDPKLVTIVVSSVEADALNHAVQVYAKDALFYRSECPAIDVAFREGRHLAYSHPDNPMDTFLGSLPGMIPRDTSLDHFIAELGKA
jgi:hypothetical protein